MGPNASGIKYRTRVVTGLIITIAFCTTAFSTEGAPANGRDEDQFSWLEDSQDPRTSAWVKAQNERTRKMIFEDEDFERYYRTALDFARHPSRVPGIAPSDGRLHKGWIYNMWQDAAHERGVWRRASLASFLSEKPDWQTLLDIDKLARAERRNWAPTPAVEFLSSGDRSMIKLSGGGSRTEIAWREFDLARRAFVPDGFVLARAPWTTLTWKDVDTLLVASEVGSGPVTRTGGALTIREWSRGTDLSSAVEIFRGDDDDVTVAIGAYADPEPLQHSVQGSAALTLIMRITARTTVKYSKLEKDGTVVPTVLPGEIGTRAVYRGEFVFRLLSNWRVADQEWKAGSIVSVPVRQLTSARPDVHLLAEPRDARSSFIAVQSARGGVLVYGTSNASGRLQRYRFDSGAWRELGGVKLPEGGRVMPSMSDEGSATAFAAYESFLRPPTLYTIDVSTGDFSVAKRLPAQFDEDAFETEQLEATSRDGTRVPYFVTRSKRVKTSGNTPALLYGYGAYGGSTRPTYSGAMGRFWLERGGIYAAANIRGGGEFGPAWHVTKAARQKTYDDFVAVAQDLVRRGMTSAGSIGVTGSSAGGLLSAVMLTQHPQLFGAAILDSAYLDQFRPDLTLAGLEFAAREYGSPDVADERAFLARTSPFQNLSATRPIALPLILSSRTDDTVRPAQPRRFAAKMDSQGMPFLYFETEEGGHGSGRTPSTKAQLEAMRYVYLKQRLMSRSGLDRPSPLQGSRE